MPCARPRECRQCQREKAERFPPSVCTDYWQSAAELAVYAPKAQTTEASRSPRKIPRVALPPEPHERWCHRYQTNLLLPGEVPGSTPTSKVNYSHKTENH